jgi:hypothetical protein
VKVAGNYPKSYKAIRVITAPSLHSAIIKGKKKPNLICHFGNRFSILRSE